MHCLFLLLNKKEAKRFWDTALPSFSGDIIGARSHTAARPVMIWADVCLFLATNNQVELNFMERMNIFTLSLFPYCSLSPEGLRFGLIVHPASPGAFVQNQFGVFILVALLLMSEVIKREHTPCHFRHVNGIHFWTSNHFEATFHRCVW